MLSPLQPKNGVCGFKSKSLNYAENGSCWTGGRACLFASWGRLLPALAYSLCVFWDGRVEERRREDLRLPAVGSLGSLRLTCRVSFGRVRQLVVHVCVGSCCCALWLPWNARSSWRGSGARCPREAPRYRATPERREDQWEAHVSDVWLAACWTPSARQRRGPHTCCCGSELSALLGTTLMMGLHAGSPACRPLYIGPPGPSAMGGWGGSMVPPYMDMGIPWTNNNGMRRVLGVDHGQSENREN